METSDWAEWLESESHYMPASTVRELRQILSAQSAEIDRLQKDLQTMMKLLAKDREEIARLKALLVEAAEDIEYWSCYAGSYQREKHDIVGTVSKYREAGGVTK